MNANGKNRHSGRARRSSIRLATITIAALISVSSLAVAWATSRNVASKADIEIKPPEPRPLHTKPAPVTKRHGARGGHHAIKQSGKSHGHGQQNAQHAASQGRNSTKGKNGVHSQADTTPTPTPEETPTPTPGLAPGLSPGPTPVSIDID